MKEKIFDTIGSSLFIILILLIVSLFTLMPILNMIILGIIIAYGIKPIKISFNLNLNTLQYPLY
ncbi:hypothetical protein [Methanobrevibacter arboriphilus]|uniref:hypothetical protein n=1 Tax=Methanobrevibacter arboriphilus TaxID=39441 RepID=UPI0006947BFD|nr:hypothetical protein [Methanobrevibacter arboriphilus]